MNFPVYVINLKDSSERREHTSARLQALGIPFSLREASDGTALSVDYMNDKEKFGVYKFGFHSRYLLREEIGCIFSHLSIFRDMIEEKTETACILEDDNDYSDDFGQLLDLLGSHSPYPYADDWDLLFLGHRSGSTARPARSRRIAKLPLAGYSIGEAVEIPYGAYGYMIKLKAAQKIASSIFPLRMPLDSYTGNASALGIRTFLVTPPAVVNRSPFRSTIYKYKKLNYASNAGGTTGSVISSIYTRFPGIRKVRLWFFFRRGDMAVALRRAGLISNRYAKADFSKEALCQDMK